MPDQSTEEPKRPRDLNLLSKKIIEISTEGEAAKEPSDKNPLSPEEVSEISRKAAKARLKKEET
jgi:hypothetical protein